MIEINNEELKELARKFLNLHYGEYAPRLVRNLLSSLEAAEQQVDRQNKLLNRNALCLAKMVDLETKLAEAEQQVENQRLLLAGDATENTVKTTVEAFAWESLVLREENERLLSKSAEFVAEAQSQVISLTARVAELETERDALKEESRGHFDKLLKWQHIAQKLEKEALTAMAGVVCTPGEGYIKAPYLLCSDIVAYGKQARQDTAIDLLAFINSKTRFADDNRMDLRKEFEEYCHSKYNI